MAAAGRRTAGGAAGAGGAEQPEEFSAAAYFEGDNNAVVAKRSPWTVSILNLEVPRDLSREERETGDLAGPPTVATVLLGSSRLAYALGIDKRPSTTSSSGSTSSRGRNVLSGITFTLRPCESTLLLGPSSSGRSTLMTEVMMRCQGRKSPRELGEVAVNGQWPLRQRDRRSVAHAGQGDTALTPVFTVRETFQFAAALTEDPAVVDHSEDVDGVLRILGLNHVQNTLVGDENVRGVSGGQKRRVTVGEKVMGDRIRLLCLDEITNGLDSASALALGTALRQASELSHQCVLCSLLQPSRELFEQFHNVLLLTPGGEVAYFGPRGEAVAHFESLGFVKEAVAEDADFLLRAVAAPAAGDLDLAQLWRSSPEGRRVLQEAEAGIATAKESQPSSPPVPAFARPMKEQVQILVRRGVMLTLRDPVTLQRPVAAAFFGLILGTLFLDTPQDDQGLIVTVGYLFTVLFLIFFISVTSPISAHFADREAFFSQRDQSFYCTRSYYIASIMHNAPVSLAEATLIVALSYFLQGANLGAHGGAFFFALLLLCCVGMTGVAVSRVLAHASPLESFASALGQALLLFLSFMACYAPPYLGIPSWMRWISWISPPAYAYEALVINEVNGRNIALEGGGSEDGNALAAATFGIPRIPYDEAPPWLGSPTRVMWFDVGMLLVMALACDLLACWALHASRGRFGPSMKRKQAKASLTDKAWHDHLGGLLLPGDSQEQGGCPLPVPQVTLTVENMVYEVDCATSSPAVTPPPARQEQRTTHEYGQAGKGAAQAWMVRQVSQSGRHLTLSPDLEESPARLPVPPPVEDGRLRIVGGVSAVFRPGTLTALMGESGCGKSTLLDCLAGYKTEGYLTGEVRLNGDLRTDALWGCVAGYCEQSDIHKPEFTVRESLTFAARMRLPADVDEAVKISHVDSTLRLLELDDYAEIIVGDEALREGLPKHARKRLTMGVELAANPSILFLDEPTSGLDALSASIVVSALSRISSLKGITIVCTIHQPSRAVFESFDCLLVLKRGGLVLYQGPVGPESSAVDDYVRSVGGEKLALTRGRNPADHLLDVFCGPLGQGVNFPKLYLESSLAKQVADAVQFARTDGGSEAPLQLSRQNTFLKELQILTDRQLLAHWRSPSYMGMRFLWTVVLTALTALVYRNQPLTVDGAFNMLGGQFFYVSIATIPLMTAVVPLIHERASFYREVSSGTYRRLTYAAAVQIAELPYNFIAGTLAFLLYYFSQNIPDDPEKAAYFWLMSVAMYWVFPALGQLIAFTSPNVGAASGTGALLLTCFTITMGFLINPSEIPPWWIWMYWLNPTRYILQGLQCSTLNDLQFDDGSSGEDILDAFEWSSDQRWFYCFFAVVLWGGGFSAMNLLAVRINWLKR